MVEKEDLRQFCAPGASATEQMIAAAENVTLRVISFQPPTASSKPTVVFVAGWISLIDGWEEVLRELTRDFAVCYIETREKTSAKVKGKVEYGVEDIGKDIVKLIQHFGFKEEQYLVMASSLGATAVLETCRFLETHPKALVLICPNAVFRVPKTWQVLTRLFYPPLFNLCKPIIKWYLRTFRMDIQSDPAQYEKYCRTLDSADPWKLKKAAMKVWHYQVWDKLAAIDIPCLIVGASKDKLHEPENLRRMVSLIPGAAYLDLDTNARTHSKEVVAEMRKYLAGPG